MSLRQRLSADLNYAYYFETPYEEIEYDKQRIKLDDQSPSLHYSLGYDYIRLNQYDKAIPEYEKALELCDKFDIKPWSISYYASPGYSYHKMGQYRKEKRLYRKAEKDFPDDPDLISMQTILSLTKGDSAAANHYINRYLSVIKVESLSEANIVSGLANIYYEAGMFDKAESYLRRALSFEPENPDRMNNLAYLLIDKDRNIAEGIELIDKALKLRSDTYYMLDTKGWGLFKQGKFNQALELIEKADSLKAMYNHEGYLHLQAVKKAVAGQKNY